MANKRFTHEEIKVKVNDILCDTFGIKAEVISDDSSLRYNLMLDSLDYIELMMTIERDFSIKIPDSEMGSYKECTVRDVYNIVELYL